MYFDEHMVFSGQWMRDIFHWKSLKYFGYVLEDYSEHRGGGESLPTESQLPSALDWSLCCLLHSISDCLGLWECLRFLYHSNCMLFNRVGLENVVIPNPTF